MELYWNWNWKVCGGHFFSGFLFLKIKICQWLDAPTDLEVTTGEHGDVDGLGQRHGQLGDPLGRTALKDHRHLDGLIGPVDTVVQSNLS